MHGSFALTEVVFFHRRSRTALFADLIQNFPRDWFKGWRGFLARHGGIVAPNPGAPSDWRASFLNRRAARVSLDKVLAWPIERVLIAHGDLPTGMERPLCAAPLPGCLGTMGPPDGGQFSNAELGTGPAAGRPANAESGGNACSYLTIVSPCANCWRPMYPTRAARPARKAGRTAHAPGHHFRCAREPSRTRGRAGGYPQPRRGCHHQPRRLRGRADLAAGEFRVPRRT